MGNGTGDQAGARRDFDLIVSKDQVHASGSIEAFTAAEHGYEFTLNWVGHHPILCVVVLVIFVASKTVERITTARQKLEYAEKRGVPVGTATPRLPFLSRGGKGGRTP